MEKKEAFEAQISTNGNCSEFQNKGRKMEKTTRSWKFGINTAIPNQIFT